MKRNCMSMEYWHYRQNDTLDLASGKGHKFNKLKCAKGCSHNEGAIFVSGPKTLSKPLSTQNFHG